MHQVFLTPTHLALAMEYAPGGDLYSYVSTRARLPEDHARFFFQQLIIGMDYCHRKVCAASHFCRHTAVLCCGQGFVLSGSLTHSRPKTARDTQPTAASAASWARCLTAHSSCVLAHNNLHNMLWHNMPRRKYCLFLHTYADWRHAYWASHVSGILAGKMRSTRVCTYAGGCSARCQA